VKETALSDAQSAARVASRFIPRESLGAFRAWQFADVLGESGAPATGMQARLAAAEKAAYAQGYAAGQQAGQAQAQADLQRDQDAFQREQGQQLALRLQAISDTYAACLGALEQSLADEVLALSLSLARQMLHTELSLQPQALAPLVHEAVRAVLDAAPIARLTLHPDDLATLQPGLQEWIGSGRLECVADARITPGGCEVACGPARIDATLETRWAELRAQLGQCETDTP